MANAEIRGGKLLLDGYAYVRSRTRGNRVYWDCQRIKRKECSGRAVTNDKTGDQPVVYREPTESPHQHAPNQEETTAVCVTETLKRKAAQNPSQPPSQFLRTEPLKVSSAVLSRPHPDLFTALRELQLEQPDTETILAELSAERKVKALPRHKWVLAQERIQGLTAEYQDYKDNNNVLEFLRIMSNNIDIEIYFHENVKNLFGISIREFVSETFVGMSATVMLAKRIVGKIGCRQNRWRRKSCRQNGRRINDKLAK